MKVKAPITTPIVTGAEIRTTEAERTLQLDYLASGRCDQGRSYSDLPQLPYRLP